MGDRTVVINSAPRVVEVGIRDGGPRPSAEYMAGMSATEEFYKEMFSFASDQKALEVLSTFSGYESVPDALTDSLPDWTPQSEKLRPHVNASIDPAEPFVVLEGSFTRQQLLALLYFHPTNYIK